MTDDRRRAPSAEPVTTGQRALRELAGREVTPGDPAERDFGLDSTLGMPTATPELVATGLAQLDAQRAAGSAGPSFDALGETLDHHAPSPTPGALAGGTLDLPASDQVAPSDSELGPGQAIGHFVIRARLGEGGMGMVLAGHDADLGRPVAIKVVKTAAADNPAYRARLLREAQVMARLEHPNVVRVYEVGSDRGRLFVAMELVDGVTLTTWLKVTRRPWREIVAMFEQVGNGLAAVHRAGLVHRDFKPDNVLVDRDGRARVADFGLARVDPDRATLTPELAASLTRTGMMVGTPAYMAPEQHFGGDVDARADQYSFCIALREALLGGRPIKIEEASWGDVPRSLRAVINRGAAVDANERWASMDVVLDAIRRATRRRGRYLAAAGVVVVLGGIAGVIAMATSSSPDATPSVTDNVRVADHAPALDKAPPSIDKAPPVTDKAALDKAPPVTDKATGVDQASTTPPPPAAPTGDKAPGGRPAKSVAKSPPTSGSTSSSSSTTGATTVTEMAPVAPTEAAKKHNLDGDKPPRHEMIAAHREAVRDALKELGFGGLTITGSDRDADLRELEAKLAASTDDLERGAILYAMGQTERMQDNCIGAAKHWAQAKQLVLDAAKGPIDSVAKEQRQTQAFRFYGRVRVAEGYCALLGGRALGVDEILSAGLRNLFGVPDSERAEAWFAEGIALCESGDTVQGKQLLVQAAQHGSDKLRAAVAKYMVNVD